MSIRSVAFVSLLSLVSLCSCSKAESESSKTSIDAHSPEAIATAFFNTTIQKENVAEMAKLIYISADTLWILGSRKDAEAFFAKCFETQQRQVAKRGKAVKLLDVSVEDMMRLGYVAVVIRTQEEGREPELFELGLQQINDGSWRIDQLVMSDERERFAIEEYIGLCQRLISAESEQ